MKEFYKLVIPEPYESIFIMLLSVVLLLLENIKRFWLLLQGDTAVIARQTNAVDYTIVDTLGSVLDNISPKLVDFTLWALIGCIVFVIFSFIVAFLKNINSEAELLQYYKNPVNKAQEWFVFLTKAAVRASGVLGIIIWFFYFLNVLNPKINNMFFTSVASFNSPVYWMWLVISIVLFAFCIYVFVILARLIALKPRIFGEQSE